MKSQLAEAVPAGRTQSETYPLWGVEPVAVAMSEGGCLEVVGAGWRCGVGRGESEASNSSASKKQLRSRGHDHWGTTFT